ncbi:peptidylprolyl isomerase [Ligilactobacillus acidipiscis DSM 15836]|uniref:Foldase protein PrsA n=1 Tax=Ligilactobacillus acidipiscis DSM 15836 TaxID=1423716 RepID=A0ABR5PLD7_9LACO|nr:peptidylprolyl isomerase [Ligilactobacillus acidipiscis]KRM27755.1 peptidylprolyl isomerase [Ligilactobacillus acidipiscis DSM 15836]GAW64379.1 peptidylprolyl isomerase [Ligilactobacillus acidipiscis]GEN21256.1 foldase protein PrsA [Ligilactobacillus acidipiscis]
MKKWLTGLAAIMMTFTLAACSKTVATTSGGKITESEYYDSMKKTSSGKQQLQQMILNKVLEENYGKKVSDKKVDKQFNAAKKQYGSSFNSVLQQGGFTKSSYKDQLRSSLLLQEAVKANTKISNKDLKKQWKSYQPKVTVAHILLKNNDDGKKQAQTVIDSLNKDGSYKNFKALAKKYSTDDQTKNNGGKLPAFDNTDTSLVGGFKKAAFKLDQGKFTTEPVKTSYGYHVIYSIKNPGKGKMSDHKAELKKQILNSKMQDQTYMQKIISKELKHGKVNIKDNDLKDILADYIGTDSKSSNSAK